MTDVLLRELHVGYIKSLQKDRPDYFEFWSKAHLRVSGVYWGLVGLDTMNSLDAVDQNDIIEFTVGCQHEDGGFGGGIGYDPHLLYTTSAIQNLAILGQLDRIDFDRVANWVATLQLEDGSFSGDKWGEVDTRFSYCAICTLSLIGKLDVINIPNAVRFILSCQNFDGAFGVLPGAESHGGQTFCCVGALDILNAVHLLDADKLGWWLAERQIEGGGLNGRPEKLADVCYSWWNLSALSSLSRIEWIDKEKLINFILSCQDDEKGGIADKPGNVADVYHSCFGLTGLSLLGYPDLEPIDPRYCLTTRVVSSLSLTPRPQFIFEQ